MVRRPSLCLLWSTCGTTISSHTGVFFPPVSEARTVTWEPAGRSQVAHERTTNPTTMPQTPESSGASLTSWISQPFAPLTSWSRIWRAWFGLSWQQVENRQFCLLHVSMQSQCRREHIDSTSIEYWSCIWDPYLGPLSGWYPMIWPFNPFHPVSRWVWVFWPSWRTSHPSWPLPPVVIKK